MVISEIRIYPLKVPLKEPFVISLGTIYHARNLLIEIKGSNGMTGQGECSPYSFINGEMLEGQMALAPLLAKLWIGKNPLEIENRMLELDKLLSANLALKSAFDMALYDLNARYAQMPLYQFLGGANDRVLYSDRTVSVGEPEKMAREAAQYLDMGFQSIKLKLGGPVEIDVLRMAAIREAIGDHLPLRIDANQAWTVSEAVRTLRALEKYNIEHCEEPIEAGDLVGLKYVRENSPIPIMADESLFDHRDAIRLVQCGACDYFNIKLTKSGGIANAMKITAIAQSAGIASQVGCFSETRLGITALVQFVLANKNVIHFDLDSPLMLAEDPIIGGVMIEMDGRAQLTSDAPGLGAVVKEEYKDNDRVVLVI
nr:dipeptide epimerase [Saprospiraceae bacterium]